MKYILIPNENGGSLQISEDEFLIRFPNEASYLEYLKQQTPQIASSEVVDVELLKLAEFIYDEPVKDNIPFFDISLKIHSLNTKIKYGIETSRSACEKIKQHNPEIPCTPFPENIFWAKLNGIRPLQFLEQSFNAAVTVEDAIKFSISENIEVNNAWDAYKSLLRKYIPHDEVLPIGIEPTHKTNDTKIEAKEFEEIMKGNAASKFLAYEKSDKMQVLVRGWMKHNDELSLCGLIYHLYDQAFLRNLNGGDSDRAVLSAARRFFEKRYNNINLSEHFRKEGKNPIHKRIFEDLKNY